MLGTLQAFWWSGDYGAPPPPADVIAPTAAITNPAESATLIGTVLVQVSAFDAVGVVSVEIGIDGLYGAPITDPPYEESWDTTLETDGPHLITARATDAAANVGYATPVMISTLNNYVPGDVDNLGRLIARFGRVRRGSRR